MFPYTRSERSRTVRRRVPPLGFNGFDIVLGLILAVSALAGVVKGFTKEVLGLASLVAGIVVAMWWHGPLAGLLGRWVEGPELASAISFAAIFIACVVGGAFLASALAKLWSVAGVRWIDRLLGGGFGFLRGLLVSAVILLVVISFAPSGKAPSFVSASKVAPVVVSLSRLLAAVAPEGLREAFGSGLEKLEGWRGGSST